jgi:hypothetical protein
MAGDDHSAVQSNLVFYLRARYNKRLKIRPELHARVKQTRFRIPDIMAVDRQRQQPLLCIEIKSRTIHWLICGTDAASTTPGACLLGHRSGKP